MPIEGEIKRAREVGRRDNDGSEQLIWRVCRKCGAGKWIRIRSNAKICHGCLMIGRFKESHPTWKGGRIKQGYGYISVYIDKTDPFYAMNNRGYVMEHRLVMAKHLGRCLDAKEVVHHLNGIRDDNRFKNLAMVDNRTHPQRTLVQLQQERIKELEQLKQL